MSLRRIDWLAYALSLIKYRGWERERAIEHVRRLYRYERKCIAAGRLPPWHKRRRPEKAPR